MLCKRCQAAIPAADVNVARMVAKCRACDAVFDFSDQLKSAAPVTRTRGIAPLPQGMRVVQGARREDRLRGYRSSANVPEEVSIQWRWFRPAQHLGMLFFAIFWNGFLVFWYTVAVAGGGSWFVFVFPLLHVGIGVSIGYRALAGLLNKTTVTVSGDTLTVKHRPLPWRGNRRIPVSQILQLYAVMNEHKGKNGVTHTYDLRAVTTGERELALVKGLPESAQALYLEQVLESALAISDAPVAGELAH
jgi:hypothetical protein